MTTKRELWSTSRSRYSRGASQQISILFVRMLISICSSERVYIGWLWIFNKQAFLPWNVNLEPNPSFPDWSLFIWMQLCTDGSSYLKVLLPTVTAAAYGSIYVFYSGSSIIGIPSRRSLYSKWTWQSRGILRVDYATTTLLLQCGDDDHDNRDRETLWQHIFVY